MLTFTFGIHDEYFRKSSKIKINSFILKYNTNYDERFFRFCKFLNKFALKDKIGFFIGHLNLNFDLSN